MKDKRTTYFDILNIIAIISVIAMHCNSSVHWNPNARSWPFSLAIECICYFAVPLFFMLSGANLMEYRKKYNTKTFFRKRFSKVVIPFIFWALVMFLWKIYIVHSMQPYNGLRDFYTAFITNKEESTYYFVWNMIGIYITMPLLSLFAEDENKKTLWFICLLYFIFNAFIPNVFKFLGLAYNGDMTIQIGGYVIFVILGYLLSHTDISKKYRLLLYLSAFAGIVYRYLTTFFLSKTAGIVIKTTWGYSSWHSILLACAVFVFIKKINFDKLGSKTKTILCNMASCSYGIYLIHQIIMPIASKIFMISLSSWQWKFLGIFITYIISFIIVYVIKKIPLLKRVV